MKRRGWIAGMTAAVLTPAAARAQTNGLRIAITADDSSAQPIYARELGFFKKAGIDADVGPLANGGAILSAAVSGAIDIGISNVVSAVAAFRNGIPICIVAEASIYDGSVPQLALLVAKNSP